jgi:predicted O-methyltransferase YrrM
MEMYSNSLCPVPVMQAKQEFEQLLTLFRQKKPKNVLEIGSMFGGTLWHWITENEHGAKKLMAIDKLVWSLDTRYEDQKRGHETLWGSWTHDDQHLLIVNDYSQNPTIIQLAADYFVDGIDFLFIDGDHRYRGVKADFEAYMPFVNEGGIVAFHDIYRHTAVDQVDDFWKELQEIQDLLLIHPDQYDLAEMIELSSVQNQTDLGIGVWIK